MLRYHFKKSITSFFFHERQWRTICEHLFLNVSEFVTFYSLHFWQELINESPSPMIHQLNSPEMARFIRFTILSVNIKACLKVEVYRDKGKETTDFREEEINWSVIWSSIIVVSFFFSFLIKVSGLARGGRANQYKVILHTKPPWKKASQQRHSYSCSLVTVYVVPLDLLTLCWLNPNVCLSIQMEATKQYFHVLLFIMLYSLVLTFKFVQRLPGRVTDLLDGFVDIGFQSWILCFAVMLDSTPRNGTPSFTSVYSLATSYHFSTNLTAIFWIATQLLPSILRQLRRKNMKWNMTL